MTNFPHTYKLEKNGIRKKEKKRKKTEEPQFGEAPERLEWIII